MLREITLFFLCHLIMVSGFFRGAERDPSLFMELAKTEIAAGFSVFDALMSRISYVQLIVVFFDPVAFEV